MNRIGKSFRDVLALSLAVALVGGVCERGRAQLNTQKDASFVNLKSSVPVTNVTSPSASASTTSAGKSASSLSSLPPDAQGPISAALGKDDSGYWVRPSAKGFRGENPRHALVAEFTRAGAEVRSHNLRWGMETRGYGYGDALNPVRAVAPQANANRVEYRRDGVTEWYENGPLGLEQGFTLAERPGRANGQALTLELRLIGDLVATLEPGGKALDLRRKDGETVLRYTGLKAQDATGRELRSWLEVRGERLLVRVGDAGARYPVVVDPWVQQAELTASDGVAADKFGTSVAMDGSTVVVGAPQKTVGSNSTQGAAYVFVQSGGTWSQQAELTASDGAAYDQFGSSVAVSGSTVVVGAGWRTVGSNNSQGAVYVFGESGGTWSQQAELTASDGANNNYFGFSVALSGSTVVVGATGHPAVGSNVAQGAAYVFVESGGTWSQQAELTASDGAAYDQLGSSVALSGSTVVAGAPCHSVDFLCQGAAYVFVESGGTWSQQTELTVSDGAKKDDFGWSVALGSSTLVVGAPHHMVGSNITQGAAYVFVESGGTWNQQAELSSSDGVAYDFFGYSVALSGSTVVAGAPQHPYNVMLSAPGPGASYVFVESGGTWNQQAELTASDGADNDGFGHSVAVDGSTAVAGAIGHTVGSNSYQGAEYVFGSSGPLYTLSASPNSLSIVQGNQGTSTITITPENGFNSSVSFSASGLPSGVTAVFNPNPATSTSTLTLTASGTATTGTTTVTVIGTSGSLTQTTTLTVTVTPAPAPSFTLSASPNSLSVVQGSQGTSTITITPENGFNGSVSFSASGLPSGVTAAFNPNPATSTSTLTLTASGTATTGTTTVTVIGTSGSLTQTTTLTLTVTSASSGDFTIGASPTTVTISSPGQSGTTTITITPSGGFNQTITFTGAGCSGLPTGASCSFNPGSVKPNGGPASTTLTFATTAASAAIPRWPLGGRQGIFFALAVPGLLILGAGGRGKRRSGVDRAMLFILLVGFSLVSFNGCGGGGGGGGGGTPGGTYTVTATATASGLSHSTTLTLVVK
jgi:nucleoside-specific outer membrane channel protein Tsx